MSIEYFQRTLTDKERHFLELRLERTIASLPSVKAQLSSLKAGIFIGLVLWSLVLAVVAIELLEYEFPQRLVLSCVTTLALVSIYFSWHIFRSNLSYINIHESSLNIQILRQKGALELGSIDMVKVQAKDYILYDPNDDDFGYGCFIGVGAHEVLYLESEDWQDETENALLSSKKLLPSSFALTLGHVHQHKTLEEPQDWLKPLKTLTFTDFSMADAKEGYFCLDDGVLYEVSLQELLKKPRSIYHAQKGDIWKRCEGTRGKKRDE
jgi:hypothetical protein